MIEKSNTLSPIENAPGGQTEGAKGTSTKRPNRNAKSTAMCAQYLRIFDLTKSGEKSTLELRRNGVMAPAPRTKEMRERYDIPIRRTRRQDLYDEQGYRHPRVAFYGIDDLDDASEKMKQFGFIRE
jgi:hypothetical protein